MATHTASSWRRHLAGSAEGRVLALVPLAVGALLAVLMLPRSAQPDEVPLPFVDVVAIQRQIEADRALANQAEDNGLPGDVRALGSALRDFHKFEAEDATAIELSAARRRLDAVLAPALEAGGADALLRLRAVQLEGFLVEVRRFEASGEESAELNALGGSFLRRMRREGWCVERTLLVPEHARRAMFKQMWNQFLSLEPRKEFALGLDELRALYAFYLSHPHAPEGKREAFNSARRVAPDPRACLALEIGERQEAERWRLDKINKLAAIDPSYPAPFARGVAHYRAGNYGASAEAFRDFLREKKDGPLALRAENHYRAAVEADRAR